MLCVYTNLRYINSDIFQDPIFLAMGGGGGVGVDADLKDLKLPQIRCLCNLCKSQTILELSLLIAVEVNTV